MTNRTTANATGAPNAANETYPHLFEPIEIAGTMFRNRIWAAPTGTHLLQGREAWPNEKSLAHYAAKAAGGAAVITYSAQNMDLEAPYDGVHAAENILKPESHRFFSQFTSAIHAEGAKVSLELLAFSYHHVLPDGTRVRLTVNDEEADGEPAADAEPTAAFTMEDVRRIARTYGDAAEAALSCGFDMLLIHGGHGLTISQFYSPALNHRADEFGADTIENRMRFARMVLEEIRARVGRRLLIEYRISGEEDPRGHTGYTVDDCIQMLVHIQDLIDIAHVSTGAFYNGTENITHPTEFLPHGCNVGYAAAIKASPQIHVPVLTLGAIQTAEEAEGVLSRGEADLVAMARGLIADPERPTKWREGRADEAIPCIRCFNCLDYGRAPYFACSVNPEVGREYLLPVLHSGKADGAPAGSLGMLAVVGGGPAGMQAAITGAQRGFDVVLFEQKGELGGKLVFSRQVPFKSDLARFMEWQVHMVEKLGVEVRLGHAVTPEEVAATGADAVIAAVGSSPVVPAIPGASASGVVTAEEAYRKAARGELEGARVAVVGGGLVGCETGLYLATEAGCRVSILETRDHVAEEEMHLTRDALLDELAAHTEVICGATCTAIGPYGVRYRLVEEADTGTDDATGQDANAVSGASVDAGLEAGATEHELDCDLVVLACGMRARQGLAWSFAGCAPRFEVAGDCDRASNVRHAVRTAYDAAWRL